MCDYFSHRMENSQGDLTDIVRNRSMVDQTETSSELHARNEWQLLPEPPPAFPLPDGKIFGDPFAYVGDPTLHELARGNFFGSSEASGSTGAQKKLLWEEGNRPSGRLLSRMPQISLATRKEPSAFGGSPSLLAHCGGSIPIEISSQRLMAGIKKRKSQAKKVVCIPAPAASSNRQSGEVVPSDLWAWRKYGQKPIKGSPYPRGYYRCSSSKGCSARKQVERSRTDPNMLVITYTSEHNHPWPTQRNALAGSSRSQPSKTCHVSPSSKTSPLYKEEHRECLNSNTPLPVKQEAQDESNHHDIGIAFENSFHAHVMPNFSRPDDFFADLEELDSDQMKLAFMGDSNNSKNNSQGKTMNPFSMFEWGQGEIFGEAKRGL